MSFTAYPKQVECFDAVQDAVLTGKTRTIIYGGAAGGGKSYGAGAIMAFLANQFPRSRWVIVDQSYPILERNLYPTLLRTFPKAGMKSINLKGAKFRNGSEILFMNEDIHKDPEGTRWLGIEVNGAWIEQVDRISQKTYEMLQSRLGRWVIQGGTQPHPMMLLTTNPVDNWVKTTFYEPWRDGRLEPDHVYISATVNDNDELKSNLNYLKGFEYLDPNTRARLLLGDWDAFEKENRFAYCFKEKEHTGKVAPVPNYPVLISFDFNVDPLAFVAFQSGIRTNGKTWVRVLREFTIPRHAGDQIKAAADTIRSTYPWPKAYPFISITGDASGHKDTTRSKVTDYQFMQTYLGLNDTQMCAPKSNMSLSDSRTLINTVISCDDFLIDASCKTLISEMKKAEAVRTKSGTIEIMKDRDKNKCDHFDAFRYGIHHIKSGWKPPGS